MKAVHLALALPREHVSGASGRLQIREAPDPPSRGEASLWINQETPVREYGPEAIVVGTCLRRQSVAADASPYEPAGNAPSAWGRAFMATHWGAYLLVIFDSTNRQWCVCADPSGLLPVFRRITESHMVLATEPGLLERMSGRKLVVSWSAVRRHLLAPDLRQRQTCFEEVDELSPGVLYHPGATRLDGDTIWNVADHLPDRHVLSFAEAREDLRQAATEVFSGWIRFYGTPAVAVSGGVDSSLICSALAASELPFGCITLATNDRTGDEREFARSLASHHGVPLVERVYNTSSFDPFASASRGLPRPSRRAFLHVVDTMLAQCLPELDTSVVFDGNGGDNLFCFLHSAAPVADRIRNEGIGKGSLSTLLDMCRLTQCDLSTMTVGTLQKLWRIGNLDAAPLDERLLTPPDDAPGTIEPLVKWLGVDPGTHRGKHDHLFLIMKAQHHIHGVTNRSARFSPLMSQPLIETCLRIPTWLWPTGGVNRALARAAFADRLPPGILQRTTKAGPDSFIRNAFRTHYRQLRELLVGGLLAENGVVDTAGIERAFVTSSEGDGDMIYRLLDLVEAENWSRSWPA
jgi:asparagine synthase (glutamine-hydrolysing)